ncbi:MAG: hypothetical protein K9M03_03350 [Kiritimatiellales bacterium]|nr:hypothetical protein [Kiritimatiellales bacterium]
MMNLYSFIIMVMNVMIGYVLITKKLSVQDGLEKFALRAAGWLIFVASSLVSLGLFLCLFIGGTYEEWQVCGQALLGIFGLIIMRVK